MATGTQPAPCSQTCPMVDSKVSSTLFTNIGYIKGRVDDIYARQDKHETRISALERQESSEDGAKKERGARRARIASLAGAGVALLLGIANLFIKH